MDQIFIYFLSGLIIMSASFIRGTTGFGMSLVALPLLSLLYPIREMIILLVILNAIFSIILILRTRGTISKRDLLIIILFSMIGVLIGAFTLKSIDGNFLKLIIGIIISGLTLLFISGFKIVIKRVRLAYSIVYLLGGILAGGISMGGAPVALILTATGLDREKFRYSISLFLLVSYISATIFYFFTDMIQTSTINLTLITLPFMIAGLILGERLFQKINQVLFRKTVIGMLLVMGIMMLYNGIKSLM